MTKAKKELPTNGGRHIRNKSGGLRVDQEPTKPAREAKPKPAAPAEDAPQAATETTTEGSKA